MLADYRPQQLLRFYFASDSLVNIRITADDQPRVIQCRTKMTFVQPIDIGKTKTITIENLTLNTACNVTKVCLNYLDLTNVIYQYCKTHQANGTVPGGLVLSDLYRSDICVIDISEFNRLYFDLLPLVKDGTVSYHLP